MNNSANNKWKPNKLSVVMIVAILLLVVALVAMLVMIPREEAPVETVPATATPTDAPTEAPTEEPTELPTETIPVETSPVMLTYMAELYEKDPDVVGWVKIDNSRIDYAVVHTPEDGEKYLHMNLEGKYSYSGTPFVDKKCSMDPESTNIMIWGHNMNDGSQFNNLMKYLSENYWKEHPVIHFSTLYEERDYEIIAAFRDRVYKKTEDVFKFYNFVEPETEEEFNEAIAYFKEHSMYDTGVTAEYGDRLLTLVTCAYHVSNGRFVVVAREITEKPVEVIPTETVPATE